MTEFTPLLQQGNAWLFIPSAILLGALHGLEPGHSKTMMAAFIIAIKGTARQAVMLGLAATLSHTAIVWLIAFGGMYMSQRFTAESAEPWLQLISAAIVLGTAAWMFWRTWKGEQTWLTASQAKTHHPQDETRRIDTGHGLVELAIVKHGQPPRWRLRNLSRRKWSAGDISLLTRREEGMFSQVFQFVDCGDYMESTAVIPEPHNFNVRLSFGHRGHSHDYDLAFHARGHTHDPVDTGGLDVSSSDYQDAHQRAHANDIQHRFTNKHVTHGQILLFGLTGGLIPCPAAITILLICLQLKALALGATLVIGFSLGLALTLVTVGVGAALGVRQVAKRWRGFNTLARKAPYFSSILIAAMGVYMAIQGWMGLAH